MSRTHEFKLQKDKASFKHMYLVQLFPLYSSSWEQTTMETGESFLSGINTK